MIEYHEDKDLNFIGTIIDIETTGNYCKEYKIRDARIPRDSREYKNLRMVIFGYMNKQGLHIYCATGDNRTLELEETTKRLLTGIVNERPLYAFNCHQEMSVFYHHLNLEISFDKELQSEEFEKKEAALVSLGILDSYGDPFHNERKPGYSCMIAWERDYFEKAIQHNRACLLKEHELMMKGRGVKPIPLDFIRENSQSANSQFTNVFQVWTNDQENYVKRAWDDGKTLKEIAQAEECRRTPKAVWLRLQKLKSIPDNVPYTIEKDSWTNNSLSNFHKSII